jgi:hypothetical protein
MLGFTTNAVDWVVRHSNHRAVPSSATTGPAFQSPRLGMAARLRFQGLPLPALRLCTVPRPKGPVYRLRGRWPFNVIPQDIAVYRHAGRSSLMSWGTFRATQAVSGRDVLIAAILALLARKSRKLVRDVSHHGRTSAGRTHCHSMLS